MTRHKKTTDAAADDSAGTASADPPEQPADAERDGDGDGEHNDEQQDEDEPGNDWDASGPPDCPICGEDSASLDCGHCIAHEDVLQYGSLVGGFLYDEPMEKLVAAFTAMLPDCSRFMWCGSPLSEYEGLRDEYLSLLAEGSDPEDAIREIDAVHFLLHLLLSFIEDVQFIRYEIDEATGTWVYHSWWAEDPEGVYEAFLHELQDAHNPEKGNLDFASWAAVDETLGAGSTLPGRLLHSMLHLLPMAGNPAERASILARLRWPDFPIVLQCAELLIGDEPQQVATALRDVPGHDAAAGVALAQAVLRALERDVEEHVGGYVFRRPDVAKRIDRVKTFVTELGPAAPRAEQ